MAFGIGRSEDFGDAYRRLILEDVAAARAGLLDTALSPEDGVHGARRRLKRIRSIVRLMRPSLGRQYDAYRDDIRTVAQSLAVFRDADVLHAMATDLRAVSAPDQQALIERAIGSFDTQRPNRRRGTLAPVLRALEELELDAEDLPIPKKGEAMFVAAVHRAYRRGRRAMQRARRSRAAADFHRWRKDAKDLWHLLELARRRIPKKMRRLAARIDTLAEILGLDHDYWITGEHIAKVSGDLTSQEATRHLVASRRTRLQKDALRRGRRLYRRRPRAFLRSIRLR
jgi:CHAD domain-containing protein